jgi:hypothetical protein
MSTIGGSNIVANGLILALDAANRRSYVSGSTIWIDLTRRGNNGTLTNGPTYDSANLGSIGLDGSNDYIVIPHNAIFNFTTGLTISSWVKTTRSVDAYITTKVEDSFYLAIGPSGTTAGKASFFLNGTSGGWLQSTVTVSTGNWVNITATWSSNTSRIYVNGLLDISATRSGTLSTGGSPIYFGWRNVNQFLGNLSNYQFYNRALSSEEVFQNYEALKSRYIY